MPRMNILNAVEREAFDSPPVFNSFQRKQYFDFPSTPIRRWPPQSGLAEACKLLIKNCIICWNYLYLSQTEQKTRLLRARWSASGCEVWCLCCNHRQRQNCCHRRLGRQQR
jgi:hypothetical protein